MSVSLPQVREIYKQHLGFVPTALATFDHMTTGFPSRLVTGYARFDRFCAMHVYDPFRSVSIVLDTLVARREPGGISPEFGLIPTEKTQWIKDPAAFFFRTQFNFDFEGIRPLFEKKLLGSLAGGAKKKEQLAYYREAMGWFSLIAHLWKEKKTCADVVQARRDLLAHLGIVFRGKHVLHSDILSLEADILEYLISRGVDLNACPGVQESGVARLIDADGHEQEVLREWDPGILRLLRQGEKQAVLTIPLALLTTSLIFPHFGRDYGALSKIAAWLGVEPPMRWTCDDSWPIGELKVPRSGDNQESLHSLWADLFYWGGAKYAELIAQSLEAGKPVFNARMCDWPKE